jgi:transposase
MTDANINIPLDLPNVTVLGVEVSERGYVISVESTLKGTRCGRCGRKIQAFHEYNDWVEIRHLPILDRAVYIRYRPKRYKWGAFQLRAERGKLGNKEKRKASA